MLSCTVLGFSFLLYVLCATHLLYNAEQMGTEAHSEDRCMAELSVKWSPLLISDHFTNSVTRDVISDSKTRFVQDLTLILLADCLHLVGRGVTGVSELTIPLGIKEFGSGSSPRW